MSLSPNHWDGMGYRNSQKRMKPAKQSILEENAD